MTESGAAELFDFRTGGNIPHAMTVLLRQSLYRRLAGYEDVNDAERRRVDPVMRHVVGGRAVDRDAASTSQVARFETDVLCHPDNLDTLMAMPGQGVDRIRQHRPTDKLIEISCRVVYHARYVTFQLAEVAVPRRLYREILDRIRIRGPPPEGCADMTG